MSKLRECLRDMKRDDALRLIQGEEKGRCVSLNCGVKGHGIGVKSEIMFLNFCHAESPCCSAV